MVFRSRALVDFALTSKRAFAVANLKWLSPYLSHGEAAKAHLLTGAPVAVRLRFLRCNLKVPSLRMLVIFRTLQDGYHCLSRKTVPNGIAARTFFPFRGCWPGTLEGIVKISFDLPERGHEETIGFVLFIELLDGADFGRVCAHRSRSDR